MAGRPTTTRRSASARGESSPGHFAAGAGKRFSRPASTARRRRSGSHSGRRGTTAQTTVSRQTAEETPRGITRRGAILVVLLLAVALVLAPFVRSWVEQRHRIEALQSDIATREQAVAELKVAQKRWEDPNYVITQARKRFTYVMPGEVGYVVLDTPRTVADKNDPSGAAARQAAAADGSWVGRMWHSVEMADATR